MRVVIHFLDGTKQEFPQDHRPGGSYRNELRTDGPFLVVADVWGKETWIPSDRIARVETHPSRGGW